MCDIGADFVGMGGCVGVCRKFFTCWHPSGSFNYFDSEFGNHIIYW